jgi:transcriptional regulator with XRE-family HTH domain
MDQGERLRVAREATRMTQSHLAAAAGVSKRTVIRAEQGANVLDESLRCICSVLGLDAATMAPPAGSLPAAGFPGRPNDRFWSPAFKHALWNVAEAIAGLSCLILASVALDVPFASNGVPLAISFPLSMALVVATLVSARVIYLTLGDLFVGDPRQLMAVMMGQALTWPAWFCLADWSGWTSSGQFVVVAVGGVLTFAIVGPAIRALVRRFPTLLRDPVT